MKTKVSNRRKNTTQKCHNSQITIIKILKQSTCELKLLTLVRLMDPKSKVTYIPVTKRKMKFKKDL